MITTVLYVRFHVFIRIDMLSIKQARNTKSSLAVIYVKFHVIVRMILKNRFTIYFGTLLAQAENITDKEAVFGLMEKSKAGK